MFCFLHFILHYSQEERTIPCPFDHGTDILTGKSYDRQAPIHLKDWDVVILEERRK